MPSIEAGILHNGFTLRGPALRWIALIVLLSGMADYLAFDVGDPLAPMSAAGSAGFMALNVNPHLSPTTILPIDTHDDGCICCAAGFTSCRVRFLVAEAIATTSAWYVIPPSDPTLARVDPPPRA